MPVTLVQAAQGHSTSLQNAITVSFTSAVTAGNCVVACIGGHNVSTITSVVSGTSSPDSWAPAETRDVAGLTAEIWADPGCAGGNTQVGVAATSSGLLAVQLFEFAGVISSSPLDVDTANGVSSVTSMTWTSGTSGTAQAGDVLVGMCAGSNTSGAYTLTGPGGSWASEPYIPASLGSTYLRVIAGYQILSGPAAMTYSGTSSAFQAYSAAAAGFTSASGGPGGGAGSFLTFF